MRSLLTLTATAMLVLAPVAAEAKTPRHTVKVHAAGVCVDPRQTPPGGPTKYVDPQVRIVWGAGPVRLAPRLPKCGNVKRVR